jgi:outer membrane protein TolC
MVRLTARAALRRLRWRILTASLAAGWPLLGLGCQQPAAGLVNHGHVFPPHLVALAPDQPARLPVRAELAAVGYRQSPTPPAVDPANQPRLPPPSAFSPANQPQHAAESRQLPPPSAVDPVNHPKLLPPSTVDPANQPPHYDPKVLPITLDTVLRLAEEQNAQVLIAREKLNQSLTEQAIASMSWLPQTTAGVGYYRHEGGIQAPDGSLVHASSGALFPGVEIRSEIDLKEATFQRVNAERNEWQSRGEISKVTSEVLLEASNAYIDLLTARRGEAVARQLENFQREMLKRAEKIVEDDKTAGARAQLASVQAELMDRQRLLARLHQQGNAAAAKLCYLLGLPPDVLLVPVDQALTPLELIDPTPPVHVLVSQALTNGPGIQELQGLIGVIQGGIERMNGPGRFLPTLQLNAIEGAFGAAAGGGLDWDNRLDIGLQVKWDLLSWVTARDRRRLAESKLTQAQLTYQDLQGKLAAGVQESREGSLSGREQIRWSAEQIRHAAETYRLNEQRIQGGVQGVSIRDVMDSIRALELAHFNFLTAIQAHNKAQVQLMVLLGPGHAAPHPH